MDDGLTNQYNSAHPNCNSRLPVLTKAARTALRLFPLLLGSAVLASCDPPAGKTYTTTVSGRIVTPGFAADPSKGRSISKAEVWADPARKAAAKADGSYSLEVTHSGTFTITADYTGTDGNYKASAPKTINTSAQNIDDQNIALKYGYTTAVSGSVLVYPGNVAKNLRDGITGTRTNGVTVIVEVEGVEAARGMTKNIGGWGKDGEYHINDIAHNGTLTIKASFPDKNTGSRTKRDVKNEPVRYNFSLGSS